MYCPSFLQRPLQRLLGALFSHSLPSLEVGEFGCFFLSIKSSKQQPHGIFPNVHSHADRCLVGQGGDLVYWCLNSGRRMSFGLRKRGNFLVRQVLCVSACRVSTDLYQMGCRTETLAGHSIREKSVLGRSLPNANLSFHVIRGFILIRTGIILRVMSPMAIFL